MLNRVSLIFLFAFIVGCSKEIRIEANHESASVVGDVMTKTSNAPDSHPPLNLNLVNPYNTEIMQMAADSLFELGVFPSRVPLLTSHLYIRFQPRDSTDYNALIDSGYELFDYPYGTPPLLDATLPLTDSLSYSTMGRLYTTVPIRGALPNVPYEILEECFIPNDNNLQELCPALDGRAANDANYWESLESLAYQIANPGHFNNLNPRSLESWGSYPSGRFTIETDSSGVIAPLKNVKIQISTFVKSTTVYTNQNGYYTSSVKFIANPWYTIKYENIRGFKVYGSWGTAAPATYTFLLPKPKEGFTYNICKSDRCWSWSVINNGVDEYFSLCSAEGRPAPPSNLHVICTATGYGSSTPMFYHLGYQNILNYSPAQLSHLFFDVVNSSITSAMVSMLRYLLPDITILKTDIYYRLKASVYHELCHASHFKKTGQSQWNTFISYIIENWGYGDGTANNNGSHFCELSESFAYACERMYDSAYSFGETRWFLPAIRAIQLLLSQSILSEAQILSCMTPTVGSIDQLYSALISSFPAKALQIKICFALNAALSVQTQWRVTNNTGVKLVAKAFHSGGISRVDTLYSGNTTVLAAAPLIINSFYQIKTDYLNYYPLFFEIDKQSADGSGWSPMYEEVPNHVIHHLPSRIFWDDSQWPVTSEYINVGGKYILRYDFSLIPSDL